MSIYQNQTSTWPKGLWSHWEIFSVQIILLFASKITLEPISPQLLRDAASNLHHWRGPWVRARFCVPSQVPEFNPYCMDSRRDGPTAATTSSWILSWHSHEQYSGNPQQPLSPETTTSSPPCGHSTSKAHTSPLQAQLPLQTCFPLAFLLYHNNLLAFCWTATYCPGSFMQAGEKDSLHLSISDPYFSVFKNSPRECCLYCCCIFLSCPFILNKLLPPPQATCSHLWPALPSVFNYHFTYLLWLYAESLTLENTLHVALLSLRCWLDWLLSWPWGQDSTQRP